jgi:hypothetical protein
MSVSSHFGNFVFGCFWQRSCQAVIKQSSGSHQAVIRQSSGSQKKLFFSLVSTQSLPEWTKAKTLNCQEIVRQLSGSRQAVIRQLSGSHQAVRKSSFSFLFQNKLYGQIMELPGSHKTVVRQL